MVRLLWLTWKWKDLASFMLHTPSQTPLLRPPILSTPTSFTQAHASSLDTHNTWHPRGQKKGQVGSLAPWWGPTGFQVSGLV